MTDIRDRRTGVRCILTVGGMAPRTGGVASAIPALCEALCRRGARVELVCAAGGDEAAAPIVTPGCWRLTLVRGYSSQRRVGWARRFRRVVSKRCLGQGEIVLHDHGAWLPSNHAVAVTARRLRVPLVVSPLGMLLPWARRSKAFKKNLAWWLFQRDDLNVASLLHATSSEEFEGLRALGLRQPVAIVPNAFELPPKFLDVRRPNEPRIVLFLSRLTPKKGLDSLLRVWERLKPCGWRLIVAGPDEDGYGRRLVARAAARNAVQGVEFVGPIWGQDKWDALHQADIFVLPSLSENFGVVIAEALASGVPVITTKETPWRAIQERQCGWWIRVGDEPLSGALRDAMALTDGERHAMGQRGARLIEEEHSSARVAEQMIEVYSWLLHQGPQPRCVFVD